MTDEEKDENAAAGDGQPEDADAEAAAASSRDAASEASEGADDDDVSGAFDDADEAGEAPPDSEPPPEKERAPAKAASSKAASSKAASSKAASSKAGKKPEPPPAKSRTWWYVGLAIVVAAAVTAYQTKNANDEARGRIEAACKTVRPLEEKRFAAMKENLRRFYGDDAAPLERYLDGARIAPACDGLPGQVTGFGWNYGKKWEPPKTQAAQEAPTAAEIHDVMLKAQPRCEKKVGEMLAMLDALGGDNVPEETRQEALMICDPSAFGEQLAAPSKKAEWPPTLLEGWPKLLESYAKALAASESPPPGAAPPDMPGAAP